MHASWLAVPLVMVLATAAAHAAQEPAPPMRPVPPLPTIGLPLPHIGLPPPAPADAKSPDGDGTTSRPQRPGRDGGAADRPGSNGRGRRQQPSIVFVPVLPIAPAPTSADSGSGPTVQRAPGSRSGKAGSDTGTLAFDLEPSMAADVFVDGSYAGTTEIVGEGLELTAGRHIVELLATGYDVRRFETQIASGKTVTFRGSLTKSAETEPPAPAADTAATQPKTFYVVPGCYAGDVPPQQALLPAGCDATLVKTFTR